MRKIALASVVCYALLMVTGGAVRLTGSGLGCPDWPSCYQHQLTANVSFHPVVEFTNRLVTVVVTVVSALAFLMALARSPRRRDLSWLAGGLVAGVAAQIVLGGLVVLFKLNPYLVALHFLLTIVIVADAVWFYHLAGRPQTPSEPVVGRDLKLLARLQLATLSLVTVIGTMVTGAGPHAGGAGAKRVPIAFRDIAEAHSTVALFLIGLTLASQFAFHHAEAPATVIRRGRILLELMVVQGGLGYLQYFLHDAAWVVEFHLAGVTALWITGVGFFISLHSHRVEAAGAAAPAAGKKSALSAATSVGGA